MLFERAALIIAGKVKPKTIEEKILLYAYNSALEDIPLLKTYLNIDNLLPITEDKINAFVLGYSSGSKVNRFVTSQQTKTSKVVN